MHPLIQLTVFINICTKLIWLIEVTQLTYLFNLIELIRFIQLVVYMNLLGLWKRVIFCHIDINISGYGI